MQEYQIRILNLARTLSLTAKGSYFSDFAAIRAAKTISRADQTVQVWRGDDCIYREDGLPAPSAPRPSSSGQMAHMAQLRGQNRQP